jgi:hypothetical protein
VVVVAEHKQEHKERAALVVVVLVDFGIVMLLLEPLIQAVAVAGMVEALEQPLVVLELLS